MKVVKLSIVCVSLIVISLMFTSISFARIDPESIVGMWLFDEGSGDTAKDSSGNGNDGKLMNGAKWVKGKFGSAMKFDESDGYVDCGNVLDVTNKLTLTAWVKDSGNSGGNVVGKYEAMDKRWHIYVNDVGGDNKIYWNAGGQTFGSSPSSDIGTDWHHLAMVYDGTQSGNEERLKAYIDGEQMSLDFDGTIPETMPVISANVNIGRHSTANFFDGIIDEVAIFNFALNEDLISSIMTKGLESVSPVTPTGKLATTWATIKAK